MALVPELAAPRALPPVRPPAPGPDLGPFAVDGAGIVSAVSPSVVTAASVASAPADDVVEVVEVRSPLTIVTWAGAAMLAGVLVLLVMLVGGPIFGTAALVAGGVYVVHRSARVDSGPVEP